MLDHEANWDTTEEGQALTKKELNNNLEENQETNDTNTFWRDTR